MYENNIKLKLEFDWIDNKILTFLILFYINFLIYFKKS